LLTTTRTSAEVNRPLATYDRTLESIWSEPGWPAPHHTLASLRTRWITRDG